ncbi:MAG: PSD1 and planctomycete cytochrome C domain-containing protein [Planctomycetota bacterium]|nr:PSD1 and planctomycete cytochrome C domain-containing protein [Planctomycetota bacterium]
MKPITALVCFAALGNLCHFGLTEDRVQFNRDVLPILSDRCFHCHGPDESKRESDLNLLRRESAIEDRGGYQVVKPNRSTESDIIRRIANDDEDLIMPPPNSGRKSLTKEEVQILKDWIDQGAVWGQHWAFEKIARPEPPIENLPAIDSFVRHRLAAVGLTPSPRAAKRTLIRRVTLDLIGLPPTVKEVNDFINDHSDQAYEKIVDRLLASPHYGERMVWPWLDAARYADTGGYQGDPDRTMWPWRDWAINALNDNMPFDQFTIEQLAGDLLSQPTPEQRLATGFNRNHMHNSEGGRIAEETRVENVFDRAETTATVWLGMTLQCARCHDHKFDPTSNKDYFAFFDFFNQTTENGQTNRSAAVPPSMDYVSATARRETEALELELKNLRKKLASPSESTDRSQSQWEKKRKAESSNSWIPLDTIAAQSVNGATLTKRKDLSLHVTGKRPEQDIYNLSMKSDLQTITGIRLDALVDPDSIAKGTGRDELGNFVLTEIELAVQPAGKKDAPAVKTRFVSGEADFSQGSLVIDKAIDGQVDPNSGWAVSGHTVKAPRWANLKLSQPLHSSSGFVLHFKLRFESIHTHHTLALFRLSATASDAFAIDTPEIRQLIRKATAKRSAEENSKLRSYYRENYAPQFQPIAKQIKKLEFQTKQLAAKNRPVKVMVMDHLPKPRDTYILVKGIYNQPTKTKALAAVPSMLPQLPPLKPGKRYNRMNLAQWLVSKDNPLTARVTVNRYWQTFFGRGIVATPNDFGLQGKQPTHPKLLDWLAAEFIDCGWNVKHIHKLIVMSKTYQQSARVLKQSLEIDPDNLYLARSPRYRLPSWMIRDQALRFSGILNHEIGGPPVRPYQPNGIWEEATFGKKQYKLDSGDRLTRRSVYTFWRRIIGPTMFFDTSKRQTCEVTLSRTNTPLHALTTFNDTTFVEAAKFLAQTILKRTNDPSQQIKLAVLTLTAREPSPAELALLENSLSKLLKNFQQNPNEAQKLLNVGKKERDPFLDPTEHAALTAMMNMLMNLDEVLVRP